MALMGFPPVSPFGGTVMTELTRVLVRTPEDDLFTNPEALTPTGFLAGHSGLTREVYALGLRL